MVFELNDHDYSEWMDEFNVLTSAEYPAVLKAMDGTEYFGKPFLRESIVFKLHPMRGDYASELHRILLNPTLWVKYVSPNLETEVTNQMRVISDVEHSYLFESMEGEEFYSGNSITLRSVRPIQV